MFDELVHANAASHYKLENDKAVLKLLNRLLLKAPDLNNGESLQSHLCLEQLIQRLDSLAGEPEYFGLLPVFVTHAPAHSVHQLRKYRHAALGEILGLKALCL